MHYFFLDQSLVGKNSNSKMFILQDDLLDVVGAVKQIVALFIGVTWGCIPLLGSVGVGS